MSVRMPGRQAEGVFCTFRIGDLWFAIEVEHILQVIEAPAVTRVPLASSSLRGLANVRGQIVTIVDLRAALELGGPGHDPAETNVIVLRAPDGVGLLADEVGEIAVLQEIGRCTVPVSLPLRWSRFISGIVPRGNRLVHTLSVAEVAAIAGFGHGGTNGLEPDGVSADNDWGEGLSPAEEVRPTVEEG